MLNVCVRLQLLPSHRCVRLVAELSKVDLCHMQVKMWLPQVASAASHKHYTQTPGAARDALQTGACCVKAACFYHVCFFYIVAHFSYLCFQDSCDVQRFGQEGIQSFP